jgi:lipopolysaccharide transport system permease protein
MREITIQPARSRVQLRDLLVNGPVIRVLAARDLKAKFKQSLLGPVWILIQPLSLLGAYVVGFHGVAKVGTDHVPYAVFALAGISIWSYFQATLVAGTASIVSNGALVMKTACPRSAFPAAALLSNAPSFLIPFVASLIATILTGLASPRMLLLPIPALWAMLITAGVISITSAVTVRFRDLIQAVPFLLQFGAFVVPVGYAISTLSPGLRFVVSLNPLTGVFEAWRWAMFGTQPYMPSVYIALGLGVILFWLGWRLFARMEVRMADVI